jgi:hypothetical protein
MQRLAAYKTLRQPQVSRGSVTEDQATWELGDLCVRQAVARSASSNSRAWRSFQSDLPHEHACAYLTHHTISEVLRSACASPSGWRLPR